jgi:hypothetical protein
MLVLFIINLGMFGTVALHIFHLAPYYLAKQIQFHTTLL